jgi:hypothetical protein
MLTIGGDGESASSFLNLGNWGNLSRNLWADTQNERGLVIDGKSLKFVLRHVDVGSSDSNAQKEMSENAAVSLCTGEYGRTDFIMAPYSSTLSPIIGRVTQVYGVPSITGTAASNTVQRCSVAQADPTSDSFDELCRNKPNGRRFDWHVSVQTQASKYLPSFLSFLAFKQAKNVAIVSETATFTTAIASGARITAVQYNMPIIYEGSVDRQSANIDVTLPSGEVKAADPALDEEKTSQLDTLVDELIAQRSDDGEPVDVIAGGTYYQLCRNLIVRFKERNYMPHAAGFTTCFGSDLLKDIPWLIEYFYGVSGWDYRLKGDYEEDPNSLVTHYGVTEGENSTSCIKFRDALWNHPLYDQYFDTRIEPIYQAAGSYAEGYAIVNALVKSNSLNSADWQVEWLSFRANTIYGFIALDDSGHTYGSDSSPGKLSALVTTAPPTLSSRSLLLCPPSPLRLCTLPLVGTSVNTSTLLTTPMSKLPSSSSLAFALPPLLVS